MMNVWYKLLHKMLTLVETGWTLQGDSVASLQLFLNLKLLQNKLKNIWVVKQ